MQKKSLPQANSKFQELSLKVTGWKPVLRNGWWIKFSVHNNENILLTFTSYYTGQTIIRYFTDENDAVGFINYVVMQDPENYIRH